MRVARPVAFPAVFRRHLRLIAIAVFVSSAIVQAAAGSLVAALPPAAGQLAADGSRPDPQSMAEEQLAAIGFEGALDGFLKEAQAQYGRYFQPPDWKAILTGDGGKNQGGGKGQQGLHDLATGAARFFFAQVWGNAVVLGQLVALAAMLAIFYNLASSFGDSSFQEVAFLGAYLVLILLGVQSFTAVMDYARQAILDMEGLMEALLPVLTALLVAGGAISSAATLSPIVLGAAATVSNAVDRFVLPLLFLAAVLALVGSLSQRFPAERASGLMRQAGIVLLGVIFTSFLGLMIIRGAVAPVGDAVAVRTGKFLVKLVPVIGSMFADSVEVVAGYTQLAKGAAAAAGMALVLIFSLFPILKILGVVAVYKMAGILIQPIGDPRLTKAIGELEKGFVAVSLAVGVVAVMFFVSLSMVVGLGNLSLLLR